MADRTVRRRGRYGLLVGAGVLLVAFAALTAYELYAGRERRSADADLLAELDGAEFVEDGLLPAAGWPQWRGPRRDGAAAAIPLPTALPAEPAWKIKFGRGYSSCAVVGDGLYTMQREGDREYVVRLRTTDGTEVWRHGYETPWPGGGDGPAYGSAPRATPTVDGDHVYTVGASGILQCRRAGDGGLVWDKSLLTEFDAPLLKWGCAWSPLLDGDRVIVTPGGSRGGVVALRKTDGALLWANTGLKDPAGYSSPTAATMGGVRQAIVFLGKSVHGLAADSGQDLWGFPWPTLNDINAATPIVFKTRKGGRENDYVFISSDYGKGCALLKIDTDAAGVFRARPVFTNTEMGNPFGSPVRVGDHVYGFNKSKLTCLSLRTGDKKWERDGFNMGALLSCGDALIVFGEQGKLAVIDADPTECRIRAEADPLSGPRSEKHSWTLPALADGRLYLRGEPEHSDKPGQLLCLDLTK